MKKSLIRFKKPRKYKFRIPEFSLEKLGPYFVMGLFLFCAVETYILFFHSSYFALEEISVAGNEIVEAKEVVEVASIVRGDKLFALNFDTIESKIERDPRIHKAKLIQVSPRKLRIEVEEGQGDFYFWAGSAYLGYSGEGKFFPAGVPKSGPKLRLSLSEGEWSEFELSLEKYKLLEEWNQLIIDNKLPNLEFLSLEDLSSIYLVANGTKILLGSPQQFKLHRSKLLALFKYLESEEKRVEYIDIRFEDMVVKLV